MKTVSRAIAVEETFWTEPIKKLLQPDVINVVEKIVGDKIEDVPEGRLQRMDEAGLDMEILSLTTPGVQLFDTQLAIQMARESNDWLAGVTKKHPTRFAGFAALPMQDPKAAVLEFERSIKENGFCGALINGHTNGHFLDEEPYWPIFECAQKLDVPIYLHPTWVLPSLASSYFKGFPMLDKAAWGWSFDTGTHLLRLICSGIFDRYPQAKVCIGHMGELIPFSLERISWGINMATKITGKTWMKHDVTYYMKENVYISTSGVLQHSALLCSMMTLGIDNILFGIDDPFSEPKEAMEFLNTAPLSRADKEKLAHGNAERIFKL